MYRKIEPNLRMTAKDASERYKVDTGANCTTIGKVRDWK